LGERVAMIDRHLSRFGKNEAEHQSFIYRKHLNLFRDLLAAIVKVSFVTTNDYFIGEYLPYSLLLINVKCFETNLQQVAELFLHSL
jgi:hypothetical protein